MTFAPTHLCLTIALHLCAQDIEATKKEVQDQLKALREDNDTAMFEFRANRKLGVELRDLVAEGKIEEAQKMAGEQVGAVLASAAVGETV